MAPPADLTALLSGDVVEIARGVLGSRLVTTFDDEVTSVRLVEVEAYAGSMDPASHAFRGETPRNRSMFGPAGTLYVYRSYGIHWCMNVVVAEAGHAILLRGGDVISGAGVMRRRRSRDDHLTDGPGKLCQALGVTGAHDGTSVASGPVRLVPEALPEDAVVTATPRVGISAAQDRPWRFVATRP